MIQFAICPPFRRIFVYLLLTGSFSALLAQLPDGFVEETFDLSWDQPVGIRFDNSGRAWVWEKAGRVYALVDGEKVSTPVLDISEEVGNYDDHGMLGFALDPDFLANGRIYLMYVVDRHHLINFGTAAYDPAANQNRAATIGRVTRYELNPDADFLAVKAGSRKVLLGETPGTGIPQLHLSHGVGDLAFGTDGSLLVSCGDGTTFAHAFAGGDPSAVYSEDALRDGILAPHQDVGSYRSQLLDALSGKVLRLDPETGNGLPSNPFYDPAAPRSAQSRTYALGLRNPFRITLLPGSGTHDPAFGQPGTIYLGDVGGNLWEEINVIEQGGENFGWPIYEGYGQQPDFASSLRRRHPQAANPLASADCPDYFEFHDLIRDPNRDGSVIFRNPCDENESLPAIAPSFVHRRPALSWRNTRAQPGLPPLVQVGGWNSAGNSIGFSVEDPGSQVAGEHFGGSCTVGGTFYTGTTFPEPYRSAFFAADYDGWIRAFIFDENHRLTRILPFLEDAGAIVDLVQNPADGCLYAVRYGENQLVKFCYGTDPLPVVVAEMEPAYGASPLEIQFDAAQSFDPEGQPISFHWDFGDGATSREARPKHVFRANTSRAFPVLLTVTDSAGNRRRKTLTVSVNNTPPQAEIISLPDTSYYRVGPTLNLPLRAQVLDNEQDPTSLRYRWRATLYHNTHNHPEPADSLVETSVELVTAGCGDETYWYGIALDVRDNAGLSVQDSVWLFPLCEPGGELLRWEMEPNAASRDFSWEIDATSALSHFEIWRSRGADPTERWARIEAEPARKVYAFSDPDVERDAVYQLRIYTQSSAFELSERLYAYRNPADYFEINYLTSEEKVNVRIRNLFHRADLQITDLRGRVVLRKKWHGTGERSAKISVAHLPRGVYVYRLKNGSFTGSGKLLR